MKNIKKSLAALFLLCLTTSYAQLNKAEEKYNQYNYSTAIPLFEKYLEKNETDKIARYKLADSYKKINKIDKSIVHLKILASDENPQDYILKDLINQLRIKNNISEARKFADIYATNFNNKESEVLKESIKRYNEFIKTKGKYNVNNLTQEYSFSVMCPSFYKDGKWIITMENNKANTDLLTGRNSTDLYITDADIDKSNLLSKELSNKTNNNGISTYNAHKQEIYYNTTNQNSIKESGFETNKLKIVRAVLDGDKWIEKDDFPWNDSEFNTAHPHLSEDGNTLFFSSDRKGGSGGMDIYFCIRNGENWSMPINIKALNTSGHELFPTIKSNKLYFASNGLPGLGGLDLFESDKSEMNFSKPKNLHAPFNTTYDDFHIVEKEKNSFYVSSNREGNHEIDDIFILSKAQKKEQIKKSPVEITIRVEDKYTKTPLPYVKTKFINKNGTTVYKGITNPKGEITIDHLPVGDYKIMGELNDVSTTIAEIKEDDFKKSKISRLITHNDPRFTLAGKVINISDNTPIQGVTVHRDNLSFNMKTENESLKDGTFFFQLEQKSDYKISGTKEGWLSSKVAYETTKGLDRTKQLYVELVLELQQPKAKAVIRMDNIFYDLNKCDIKPKSAEELDRLVLLMQDYPDMKIELSSHTDSRGTDSYNETLSQCRADAAVAYLVKKGIDRNRLVAKGYGENKITNRCSNGVKCSEEEHQQNRRTEFKITSCITCP